MLRAICPSGHVSKGDVSRGRVECLAGRQLEEHVLIKGEIGTYLDYCPVPWGCLATRHSRLGAVDRVWPFLPDEIGGANSISGRDYSHERPLGWTFSNSVRTFNIARLGDDLIVVFDFADTFPGQGGWRALRQMAGRAGTARTTATIGPK